MRSRLFGIDLVLFSSLDVWLVAFVVWMKGMQIWIYKVGHMLRRLLGIDLVLFFFFGCLLGNICYMEEGYVN